MLYVFYVDTGTTIKFDMEYLNKTVQDLKEAIERECGVHPEDQILLMSGGCYLEKDTRVISYAGGTDGNPIFFFNIGAIKNKVQPPPILNYGSDVDLTSSFDNALALPVSLSTVSSRCKLAKHCYDLSREQFIICERLVQDQHHMHLGWTAAIANLDDISKNHLERIQTVYQNISTCLNERQEHMQLIESFRADLQNLAKIPILPALESYVEDVPPSPEKQQQMQTQHQQGDSISEPVSGTNTSTDETPSPANALSLLKWIVAKDSVSSLEEIADTCLRLLQQLDERILESLKTDMGTVEAISNDEMKDIKGLGDRLFALQGLLAQMKKLESDQHDLTSSLEQSKSRIKNIKDESVLPDLCSSHREHLGFMFQNYNQMRDIRRRCTKAKEELAANIHERLRWVAYVEDNMFNTENKLKMFYDNLRRLRQNLSTLRQIHMAPQMYMSAITEVVRRRTFSQAFLNWASNLACQLLSIHNEEVERRREFKSKFEGHFLNYLFPGLEDTPPPFATQAPSVFDNSLPKLTTEDMDSIREQFPDLAQSVTSPNLNSITQFFSKSFTDSSSEGNREKENALMPIDGAPKGVRPPLLSDRGGFESETDTEEFEKIGQAAMDSKQTSIDSMKQPTQQSTSRQKQLEESLNSTREEVERLRGLMNQLKSAACEHVAELRRQVGSCRQATLMERAEVARVIAAATEAVRVHAAELRQREQELTVDHELELSDLKKLLQASEEQLQSARKSLEDQRERAEEQDRLVATCRQKFDEERQQLQTVCRKFEETLEQVQLEKDATIKEISEASLLETNSLKKALEESEDRIRKFEVDLEEVKTEHQRALKEETDKLQMEYKTQLETIRGRFKLMAASTMERSPSDSSLEKIERVDVIELVNHETILAQTKKDAEVEKEEAVRAAVEHERGVLTRDLQMAKDTIKKRERDLELYRQREISLLDECRVYKSTIEHLKGAELVIKNLESDKAALEHKISLDHGKSEQLEKMMHELECERDRLKQELEDERLKMSQTNIDLDESLRSLGDSEKDEIRVSESKKVKLEPDSDSVCMRTVEALEADNKRLSSELRSAKEGEEILESKVEILQNEKSRLEVELVKERSKRNFSVESLHSSTSDSSGDKEMSASVSVVHDVSPNSKSRMDASTITERTSRGASSASTSHSARDKLTKSTSSILPSGKANAAISSCNPGDIVLVLWDMEHRNFIVLQDSETFYFVNSDCLPDLGLKMAKDLEQPPKSHVLAEVVDKEYCSARKMENRYRVPQGTKFYRVRVKEYRKPPTVGKK